MKEFIFVVERFTGTGHMRGYQVHRQLMSMNIPSQIMTHRELYKIFPQHHHKKNWNFIFNPYRVHLSPSVRKDLEKNRVKLNDDCIDDAIHCLIKDKPKPETGLLLSRAVSVSTSKELDQQQRHFLERVCNEVITVLKGLYHTRLADTFKNKIVIVVKIKEGLTEGLIKELRIKGNVVLYDPVDAYVKKNNEGIMKSSVTVARNFDAVICINTQMQKFYQKCGLKAICIHHHWDPRLREHLARERKELIGFMGEHRHGNCLYVKSLKIPKTESFSNIVENGSSYRFHYSVRDPKSVLGKYKSNIKIATAAAMKSNIVVSPDSSVIDMLNLIGDHDYPYLLKDSKESTVISMLDSTQKENKEEAKGLKVMDKIKDVTSISYVAKLYVERLQPLVPVKLGNIHRKSKIILRRRR